MKKKVNFIQCFSTQVKLGAVDATVHQRIAGEFNIRGYPTIKFFSPGSRSASDAQEYNGGRTSQDIVTWALNKYTENVPPPEIKQVSTGVVENPCIAGLNLTQNLLTKYPLFVEHFMTNFIEIGQTVCSYHRMNRQTKCKIIELIYYLIIIFLFYFLLFYLLCSVTGINLKVKKLKKYVTSV